MKNIKLYLALILALFTITACEDIYQYTGGDECGANASCVSPFADMTHIKFIRSFSQPNGSFIDYELEIDFASGTGTGKSQLYGGPIKRFICLPDQATRELLHATLSELQIVIPANRNEMVCTMEVKTNYEIYYYDSKAPISMDCVNTYGDPSSKDKLDELFLQYLNYCTINVVN